MTIDTAKERERLAKLEGHTGGTWCDDYADHDAPYQTVTIKSGRRAICEVWMDDAPLHDFNAEQRNNVRLIAAAPDLKRDYLAALDVIDAQAAEIERLRYFLQEFISIDEKGQLCDAQSFGEGYTSNDLQNLLFDAKKILSEREP